MGGKASPYIDTACDKVPLLQDVVKRLVPYAKPSVQLADKLVDRALELASKPVELLQSTGTSMKEQAVGYKAAVLIKVTSIKGQVVDCKAAAITKAAYAREVTTKKLFEYKGSAIGALQKSVSLVREKRAAILQVLQQQKVWALAKLGHAASWANESLQAVAARLHLTELMDMARDKASAGKSRVVELKDTASRKGSAGKEHIVAFIYSVQGKAYSVAVSILGKSQVDYVSEKAANYAQLVKKTQVVSGSAEELGNKKEQ